MALRDLTRIEPFSPREEKLRGLPTPPGKMMKMYEFKHRRAVQAGVEVIIDKRVKMDTPKEFTSESVAALRKHPRYYARRFGMWDFFEYEEDYKDYLMTLQSSECRNIDNLEAKQRQ